MTNSSKINYHLLTTVLAIFCFLFVAWFNVQAQFNEPEFSYNFSVPVNERYTAYVVYEQPNSLISGVIDINVNSESVYFYDQSTDCIVFFDQHNGKAEANNFAFVQDTSFNSQRQARWAMRVERPIWSGGNEDVLFMIPTDYTDCPALIDT